MTNNNQIQLVECARYHMATRYSTESKRPATISLGGLYWKSHTPASTEDAEFINRAVAAANSCVTPLAAPPVNGDAAGTVASVRTASSGRRIPVSEVSRVLQGGHNGTNERD